MMQKTFYVEEVPIGDCIVLVHLLTFQLCILKDNNACAWQENDYGHMDANVYVWLLQHGFIIREVKQDTDLLCSAMSKFSRKKNRVPNIGIYITTKCNLRCSYCYTGYLHDKKQERTITECDVDKIFFAAGQISLMNDAAGHPLVSLLGGEPLLPSNRGIIDYIFDKLVEEGYPMLEIVSNFIFADHFIDIFNRFHSPIYFRVTFNGSLQIHDGLRKDDSGKGTYQAELENIKLILNNVPQAIIEISILLDKISASEDSIRQLFIDFDNAGLLRNKRVDLKFGHIQFRGLFDNNGYQSNVIPLQEYYPMLFQLKNAIDNITLDMLAGSAMHMLLEMYHSWMGDSIALPSFGGCDAVSPGRYCFFPDGKIYPCFDVVGMEGFEIGGYRDGFCLNDKYSEWASFDLSKSERCMKCKYAGICNGGCLITNTFINNSIYGVVCNNFELSISLFIKSLVECGLINV